MKLAADGSMRKWTILIGIGIAIFCFGLCLLIFGRAYEYDASHHDLFLAFGCVFMIPGGLLVLIGAIQLFRIYIGYLRSMPSHQTAPPMDNQGMRDDVFAETPGATGKGDFIDHGQMRPPYNPHESTKSAI